MVHSKKELDYRFDLLSDHNEEDHFHQDVELIYVLHGTAKVRIESESYQLSQEDILIINMNKRHSLLLDRDSLACQLKIPYSLLNYYLKQDYIMFWCNTMLDSNEHYHSLRVYLRQMLNCMLKHPDTPDPMTTSYFYELFHYLCEHFLVGSGDERFQQEQNKFDTRINEIISYIEENYEQHISLNELADQLHLTYSYLSRYFKKVIGMNFLEYVNRVRLLHAVEDLLYTDKPVTRIAMDNGFTNSSGLNKAFKEAYDMAPSAYKKQMQKKLLQGGPDSNQITHREKIYQQAKSYLADKGVEQRQLFSIQRFSIQVDGAHKESYVKNWMELINIGQASVLLKAKVQEQTLFLRDTLGFRYVRFWNVFDEDMELRSSHQTDLLNFDKLDEVLDFLVYNNLIPFIDLGDKPLQIATTASDSIRFDEGKPIFQSLSEFKALLERFLHHVITRYRAEQVRKWRFECWYDERTERQVKPVSYFQIFNTACQVIRSILPDAVIGGCGMKCNDVNMESFLRTWMQQPYQPDFFSVYSYPYESSAARSSPDDYNQLSTDAHFLFHHIVRTKELLRSVGMNVPLYVTEWNCTVSSRNYLNDTCYKGTYLMKNITEVLKETDVLGYWAGSDLISTYYDSKNILNGCPGLLTKDNICKPAYYAYRFLRRMGAYLVEIGENYLITTSGHFSYYIICFNYHPLNYRYFQKPENAHSVKDIQALSENNSPIRMAFQLDHLPDDSYAIKTSNISPHYGSVLDEWIRLNTMTNIRSEDIEYLKRICTPHMSIQEMETKRGQLQLEIELEPEEISLIHIYHKL